MFLGVGASVAPPNLVKGRMSTPPHSDCGKWQAFSRDERKIGYFAKTCCLPYIQFVGHCLPSFGTVYVVPGFYFHVLLMAKYHTFHGCMPQFLHPCPGPLVFWCSQV